MSKPAYYTWPTRTLPGDGAMEPWATEAKVFEVALRMASCDRCGAQPWEQCVTTRGKRPGTMTAEHHERLVLAHHQLDTKIHRQRSRPCPYCVDRPQPRSLTLKQTMEAADRAARRVESWPAWKRELCPTPTDERSE